MKLPIDCYCILVSIIVVKYSVDEQRGDRFLDHFANQIKGRKIDMKRLPGEERIGLRGFTLYT